MGPHVSVVIPVRNGMRWIRATLRSIVEQTMPSNCFEIIVVDDGSSDGTADFCRDFLFREHISWKILATGGQGVSSARNAGIAAAQAEWIQLLDADDLIHESKLETQARIAANVDPTVAVIASPWARFLPNESGEFCPGELYQPAFADWATLTLLKADGFLQVGSCLIRKTCWSEVGGFDERRTHVEDVDFLVRIADAGGSFVATQGAVPLFLYRVHSESVSHRGAAKIIEGSVANALAVQSRAQVNQRLNADLKQVLLGVYSQGLRHWFVNDRQRFWGLYQHVLELEPFYHPPGPRMLSILSRLLGYPAAEHIALTYRRLKALVRPLTSGARLGPVHPRTTRRF